MKEGKGKKVGRERCAWGAATSKVGGCVGGLGTFGAKRTAADWQTSNNETMTHGTAASKVGRRIGGLGTFGVMCIAADSVSSNNENMTHGAATSHVRYCLLYPSTSAAD